MQGKKDVAKCRDNADAREAQVDHLLMAVRGYFCGTGSTVSVLLGQIRAPEYMEPFQSLVPLDDNNSSTSMCGRPDTGLRWWGSTSENRDACRIA